MKAFLRGCVWVLAVMGVLVLGFCYVLRGAMTSLKENRTAAPTAAQARPAK
jgi:hypothetical protein